MKLLTVTSKAMFMLEKGRKDEDRWPESSLEPQILHWGQQITNLLAFAGEASPLHILVNIPFTCKTWDILGHVQITAVHCTFLSSSFCPIWAWKRWKSGNPEIQTSLPSGFLTHKPYLPIHPHILKAFWMAVANTLPACTELLLRGCWGQAQGCASVKVAGNNDAMIYSRLHILGGRLNVSNAFCIFVQAKCSLCPTEERLFRFYSGSSCRTNKTSRLPFGFRSHPSAHCCNTYRSCLAPSEA